MDNKVFKREDIPIGVCCNCGLKQINPGEGGFWINGLSSKWACTKCKYGVPIPSYPTACEWCTYMDVKWYQGNTYNCPRCNTLGIRKLIFKE